MCIGFSIMKAESFETLTVEDMAVLLHKDVTSIRSDVLRNPRSLPPVLRLPGNRRLLWRRTDVDVWLAAHVVGGPAAASPCSADLPPRRRRGRPTKAEQIARREAADRGSAV
jgi:hypothetical protein